MEEGGTVGRRRAFCKLAMYGWMKGAQRSEVKTRHSRPEIPERLHPQDPWFARWDPQITSCEYCELSYVGGGRKDVISKIVFKVKKKTYY